MSAPTQASDATYPDAIEVFLDLIENTRYEDLAPEVIDSAKIFLLDTFGVALAGGLAPKMDELMGVAAGWDGNPTNGVPIWNMSTRASAPVAAMINGYQCHALEYDCVYEPGVILPTPPIMSALHAKLCELTASGQSTSGKQLIVAFVVALEVSCTMAQASKSSMFFFRPTTTGVFSALAALCCLDPLTREQMRYAFGIGYSQMCGTMQAHEEGSMMLAMQMGFAARNAVQAHAMARAGLTAPVELLEGRFGFYHNFESKNDLAGSIPNIANPWKVTQLSHKPFPSGRVTHGVIHALRKVRNDMNLETTQAQSSIKSMRVELPPLGFRLTGRPTITNPPPNYARLCIPFVAAAELLTGRVDPTTFLPEILNDAEIEALARRVETIEVAHPNPNAFFPQRLIIEFRDGTTQDIDIPYAWGHPELPMDRPSREAKFALCWQLSRGDDADEIKKMTAVVDWVEQLEQTESCDMLLALLA